MTTEKNHTMSVLQFHGKNIVFEEFEDKMMVNATQMAKAFGQTPAQWLRTKQAKQLIKTVSVVQKCTTDDLQEVRQGGKNQGTFFQEDVALFFAQWLSPEFYLACNTKLKELLAQRALSLPAKHNVTPIAHEGQLLYPYRAVMASLTNCTRPSATRRKKKYPQHFFKVFGRNFITGHYFDLLKGYYDYKQASNQLKLSL